MIEPFALLVICLFLPALYTMFAVVHDPLTVCIVHLRYEVVDRIWIFFLPKRAFVDLYICALVTYCSRHSWIS
jgi:hypothetical protein